MSVAVPAAVVRRGQKNKPTSLGLYQKKPYIDAGDSRVKEKVLVGEYLKERERESNQNIGMTKGLGHSFC